jgi:hypothetical protein
MKQHNFDINHIMMANAKHVEIDENGAPITGEILDD